MLIRSYVKIQKGEEWSYLPFLQYDATLFGYHNTKKLEEVILSFHLRSSLSFPTMGVFYLRNPRSSTGLPPQTVFVGGYTVFTLSVRTNERMNESVSVTFCFLNILKSHRWNFFKLCKNIHMYKANTTYKKLRARG